VKGINIGNVPALIIIVEEEIEDPDCMTNVDYLLEALKTN
jgi:hypothetical protein